MSLNLHPLLVCAARFPHNSLPKVKFDEMMHHRKASSTMRKNGSMIVACGAKDSEPKEEPKAMEAVLKLYEAIKNKNVDELSDVIADECTCCSNIVSAFQPFHGKKQVLAFFYSLMKKLGNNISFVVQPTLDDGMAVGVAWTLEWDKVPLCLGKGFSLYMCHVYKGHVMIKNVEIFMEPLLHMEPLRLKIISLLLAAMEKLDPRALFKNNKAQRTKRVVLFILLVLAGILLLFKFRAST